MDQKSKELRKFINESRKFVTEEWFEDEKKLSEEQEEILFKEVNKFNEYGSAIYRDHNLKKVGKKMMKLAEFAELYLNENSDAAFDRITVNRNMKELKKYISEFQKAASSIQEGQDRMEALYEDIGLIFNRYFEIADQKKDDVITDDPAEKVAQQNAEKKRAQQQKQKEEAKKREILKRLEQKAKKKKQRFDISDEFAKE